MLNEYRVFILCIWMCEVKQRNICINYFISSYWIQSRWQWLVVLPTDKRPENREKYREFKLEG